MMKGLDFKILPTSLLASYCEQVPVTLEAQFTALADVEISTDDFSFYTSVASVYSSKIEGEDIDLDSYVKHRRFGVAFSPDYTQKTDDLYTAYAFAANNALCQETLEQAHALLAKHLVPASKQGKIRTQNMYVTSEDGRIEYVAASPFAVASEMQKLYLDIAQLLAVDLSLPETFFFASLIHLVFVKIHPFDDGNGRTGRLLEKWFIAQKTSKKAWFLTSERHYYLHRPTYYNNLRALELEYENLDYSKAGPFLLMLPGLFEAE